MSSSLARAVTCYLDGQGCGADGLFTTAFNSLNIIRLSKKTPPNGLDAGILREVMAELTQPPLPSNDQGIRRRSVRLHPAAHMTAR